MRTVLDTRLMDATAGEPGLLAELRDERRALLFDLGDTLRHLAPRTLLRASHAFVSHTHMDHFSGFDHWLALCLGRVKRLVLWGAGGFVDQLEHKLRAYTWNVVHRYDVPLCIEAHEFSSAAAGVSAQFNSAQAFAREALSPSSSAHQHADHSSPVGLLYDAPLFQVRACEVDHEMTVLSFAIDEKAQLRVAADRIRDMGLRTGPWLTQLKQAVLTGAPDTQAIDLAWRDEHGDHRQTRQLGELRPLILDEIPGRRIGYVTDLRFTESNLRQLDALLSGVDLLHIEAVFLDADRDHALRKNHLTASQAGQIAARLGAGKVVPFHFSPRYRGAEDRLRDELEASRRAHAGM